jgi:hypothetical protein
MDLLTTESDISHSRIAALPETPIGLVFTSGDVRVVHFRAPVPVVSACVLTTVTTTTTTTTTT